MGYAEASCVLKVNIHCQACKMRILEVLNSITGMYNVDINSEEGLVRVDGMVEPEILMTALARTGYHAELKWVKLRHPNVSRSSYYNHQEYDPYNRIRYLRDDEANYYQGVGGGYHHGTYPYHHQQHNGTYYQTRYVPSNPPQEHDPCDADQHSIDLCRVM